MCQAYIESERAHYGPFCGEWLPYMMLNGLRLYNEVGILVKPSTRYRSLGFPGAQLKDIVHWRWSQEENLIVTVI